VTLALTGSTGALGALVTTALADLAPVLVVRDPARAPVLPGCEVRRASYADGQACRAAFLRGEAVMVNGHRIEVPHGTPPPTAAVHYVARTLAAPQQREVRVLARDVDGEVWLTVHPDGSSSQVSVSEEPDTEVDAPVALASAETLPHLEVATPPSAAQSSSRPSQEGLAALGWPEIMHATAPAATSRITTVGADPQRAMAPARGAGGRASTVARQSETSFLRRTGVDGPLPTGFAGFFVQTRSQPRRHR
jgi:hypothetical protein